MNSSILFLKNSALQSSTIHPMKENQQHILEDKLETLLRPIIFISSLLSKVQTIGHPSPSSSPPKSSATVEKWEDSNKISLISMSLLMEPKLLMPIILILDFSESNSLVLLLMYI